MAYEVYWGSGSPYAWRVLLALTVKGIPFESKLLQFSRGDHKTPEFLAMNPRGRVPVLKDAERVVYESLAIMSYIEKLHPTPPLFGETAGETAAVWQTVMEVDHYLGPLQEELVARVFANDTKGHEDALHGIVKQVREELSIHDGRLARQAYLAGPRLTAADLVLYPTLMLIGRVGTRDTALSVGLGLETLRADHANVDRWARAIESLSGYDATYPPHWRS
ncbi:MAG TPA: glutathione S-transferase family protein [Polyangiaceae bacterium]|jgi:glutathione S-transferase|nr:glutathione S-transferase family protein [Polyangiaceae bacterium]